MLVLGSTISQSEIPVRVKERHKPSQAKVFNAGMKNQAKGWGSHIKVRVQCLSIRQPQFPAFTSTLNLNIPLFRCWPLNHEGLFIFDLAWLCVYLSLAEFELLTILLQNNSIWGHHLEYRNLCLENPSACCSKIGQEWTVMAANYWESTQKKHWQYTRQELEDLRTKLEDEDQNLVQIYPLPQVRHLSIFINQRKFASINTNETPS